MGASITDSSIASVSAAAGADVGTHTLEVTDLAVAQRLKSGTFTNITDTVGTGTLTIQYGTFAAGTFTGNGTGTSTINIDSTNNTLAGVRDAINKANVGVTASIVNDGTAAVFLQFASSASTVSVTSVTGMKMLSASVETFSIRGQPILAAICGGTNTVTLCVTAGEGL